MASTPSFDPFTQQFTLVDGSGVPFNVTIPEVDDFILYNLQICINYGAQLGACFVLLVLLLVLTKAEKRTSKIFILNCISLGINLIRNVLMCLYFTGPFSETYAFFADDFSRVPSSAFGISIAATVLSLLVLITIECSLLLQVHVVCKTLRKKYRQIILIASVNVALLTIGFRFALVVMNSEATMALQYTLPLDWIASAANITTTVSICWFCTAFVTKLAYALVQRHKLGLRSFGPMKIVFIMGCQTLIIPVIFSVLEYTSDIPEMDSNVITLVTIFLPLSSLWASATPEGRQTLTPAISAPKFLRSFRTSNATNWTDNQGLSSSTIQCDSSPISSPARERFAGIVEDFGAPTPADIEAAYARRINLAMARQGL